MIKKLLVVIICGLVVRADAGLITRTYTYTSGNTISANENNTNENTLYNEVNGNISTANILDGTIQNGDMADTQLVVTKFASSVQSTFTYVNTFGTSRRPNLIFVSVTSVDVTTNTSTSFQTCVQFPDERRCVTENTQNTSVNRRAIITEAASFSGTKNSGMAPGESEAVNTWYGVYAVKVTDVSTDFVLAISTNMPIQETSARLNSVFGTNSWVYLGLIRNGDNAGATGDILKFQQSGNHTELLNGFTAGATGLALGGILMANSGVATTLSYTYSSGTGSTAIPQHASIGHWTVAISSGTGTNSWAMTDVTLGVRHYSGLVTSVPIIMSSVFANVNGVTALSGGGTTKMDISMIGWWDDALGIGYNPQI